MNKCIWFWLKFYLLDLCYKIVWFVDLCEKWESCLLYFKKDDICYMYVYWFKFKKKFYLMGYVIYEY